MGRAIVRDPKAFLLDEPLSNLDAKLRVQMRTELARLQSRLGTTTVYVTHDQTEAMTLGDRVAVMRAGELQQVGAPAELYNDPKNLFVAGFIGSPAMNFMPAELSDGRVKLPIGEAEPGERRAAAASGEGRRRAAPGELRGRLDRRRRRSRERGIVFKAEIDLVESLGSDLYAYFHVESEGVESEQLAELVGASLDETGAASRARARSRSSPGSTPPARSRRGEEAELWADTTRLHLFDPDSGASLMSGAGDSPVSPR